MNIHQAAFQLLCPDSLSVTNSLQFTWNCCHPPWIWKKTSLINVPETSPTSQRPLGSSQGRVMGDHGQGKAHPLWLSGPHNITVKSFPFIWRRFHCQNTSVELWTEDVAVLIRKGHTVLPKWVSAEAYMAQWAIWSCEMGLVNTHISHRGICQFSGIITWYFDYRQLSKKTQTNKTNPNQEKTKPLDLLSMRLSGNKHIFPFFYWTFPEEISYLTWQQGESQ